MRFRAEQHLRRQLDFQHVRTHGRRSDCGAFMLWYCRQCPPAQAPSAAANTGEPLVAVTPVKTPASVTGKPTPARLGVVASRSAVGNSPQRARAKRRLREVARVMLPKLGVPGHDYVIISRNKALTCDLLELARDMEFAFSRIIHHKGTTSKPHSEKT